MDILAKMLHFYLKSLQERVREDLNQGPCQNESDLELPDEEENPGLFNLCFVQYELVVNDLLLLLRINESLKLIYLLCGKLIEDILFFHQEL